MLNILQLYTLQYEDGYVIENIKSFLNLENVYAANYTLTTDLDFSKLDDYYPVPIQNTFDGNGHYIMNLKINNPSGKYYGIFKQSKNSVHIYNLNLKNVVINTQSTVQDYTNAAILIPYAEELVAHNISFINCQIIINRAHQYLKAGILAAQINGPVTASHISVSQSSIISKLGASNGIISGLIAESISPTVINQSEINITIQDTQLVNSISGVIGVINEAAGTSYIENIICNLQVNGIIQGNKIGGITEQTNGNVIQFKRIQNSLKGLSSLNQQFIAGILYASNENAVFNNIYTATDFSKYVQLSSSSQFAPKNSGNLFSPSNQRINYVAPNGDSICTTRIIFTSYQLYEIAKQTTKCSSQNVNSICATHAVCFQQNLGNTPTYSCKCNQYSMLYGDQCIKINYEPEDTNKINRIQNQNVTFRLIAICGAIVFISLILFNISLISMLKKYNMMKPIIVNNSSSDNKSSHSKKDNDKVKLNLQINKPENAQKEEVEVKSIGGASTKQLVDKIEKQLPKVQKMPTLEVNKQLNDPTKLLNNQLAPTVQTAPLQHQAPPQLKIKKVFNDESSGVSSSETANKKKVKKVKKIVKKPQEGSASAEAKIKTDGIKL